MKSLSLTTCVALVLCTACTKIIDKPIVAHSFSAKTIQTEGIENLGTAITGLNVLWKINPSAENLEPLFTTLPNSNSGFALLMIDNGNRSTAPLRFISVDLQNKITKTVKVTDKNGSVITSGLGRVTRYMFGMNKKFYVATENGGHLIEYDPNTQTAIDLGQPFNIDGRVIDIYSLSLGKDGALYGGSFGGEGDVYTFRYDYKNFTVDKVAIDKDARYVTYVTGDEQYTYASCGQNSWKMYSIERATGKKTVVLNSENPAIRIYASSKTDACYAQFNGSNYKLNGNVATVVSSHGPGVGMEFLPYQINDPKLPKVVWSEMDRTLYYKFPGGVENSIKVNDLIEEVYPTTSMNVIDNKLFITGGTIPRCVTYQSGQKFMPLGGTSINVFNMAVVPNSGGRKVVMGGYPKGALLEYNMDRNWNLGIQTLSITPVDINSNASNPKKFTQLQDADNAGVFGPMTINKIVYTKDGSLVAAGNNDRITESASRELGIGTYKNGVKRNFTNTELVSYEFSAMTPSKDSTEVFISAVAKHGASGKIFKYNPVLNSITSTIDFTASKNPGNIQYFKDDLLAGVYDDVVYLMDINTKQIVWKTVLGSGQRITAFTIAPDGNIWIAYNYLNAHTSKLIKYQVDTKNKEAINASFIEVSVIKNPDVEETKPTGLVFMKSAQSTSYDLYIAGFTSVCRMKNAIIN